MSSLDLSVEDHDDYDPALEGIPERCFCMALPVLEMHRRGGDAGRMIYRCSTRDAERGGHLARWFDKAVHEEFAKIRREIQQLRRLAEVETAEAQRVAQVEADLEGLKAEISLVREQVGRERRRMVLILLCLVASMRGGGDDFDVGI